MTATKLLVKAKVNPAAAISTAPTISMRRLHAIAAS